MRIIIKDAGGNPIYSAFRDTSYKTADDAMTLYNIPVFTWEADNYGTYTVTVTVAKKYGNFGDCFWLSSDLLYPEDLPPVYRQARSSRQKSHIFLPL